jgi:bromodomain adjacent to zinc finger domain protein 1A
VGVSVWSCVHLLTSFRYFAKIVAAFPPKSPPPPQPKEGETSRLHHYAENLKTPLKDVMDKDDPAKYLYHIQIIDEERSSDHKLSVKDREQREANRAKWSASIMEVPCNVLRRVFSWIS